VEGAHPSHLIKRRRTGMTERLRRGMQKPVT
jgi:hypothetical protein